MKVWLRVSASIALAAFFVLSALSFRPPADPLFEGRLASAWARQLLSPDYTVRGDAQTALAALGEPAVPQLRALLKKRNARWEPHLVRLNSVFPGLNYRPVDAAATRLRAAEMLGLLGLKAHSAVPDLVNAMAFAKGGDEAERALIRIGPASVPSLRAALNARSPVLRERAAFLLREFGPLERETVVALIVSTHDEVALVRKEATLSLSRSCDLQNPVRNALLQMANDPEDFVRAAAFESLGGFGFAHEDVIVALREGLRDSSPTVKLEAAKALWHLRQAPEIIVRVLIEVLASPERWQAAYALGEMGVVAAPAVPALVKLLEEEEVPRPFRTPPSSAFALGKIGAPAIPQLTALLKHPAPRVRVGSLLALGFMGKEGIDAVPQLLESLRDEDVEVRHTAAITLAAVGAAADQIVSGLTDCLRAEDVYMRSAAAAVLRDIAPDQDWPIQPE